MKVNKEYSPKEVEEKWQKKWTESEIYKTPKEIKNKKDKKYVLDMFPYPSGATMHVGHLEGYIGTDILSRFYRMNGYDVLHPMGWDAFGLPAENYAIKTGIHPDISTHDNIKIFKRQLINSGLSYDWETEIDTSAPDFYKWTQWLFILMFKNGLAYKKKAPVNWCPKDETVLANEQVVDGKCERCDTPVIQKELEQWFLKITDYADRLISGLDKIDWLEEVKIQQKNWIGKKEGVIIHHKVKDSDINLDTFSAYPAWLFADTFLVIAPEHPIVSDLVKGTKYQSEVDEFVKNFKKNKSKGSKLNEKEGIFTGKYAIDPFSGNEMPIWLANFALMDFGTGIIRCSSHDIRDYEFATKYKIPLKEVVERTDSNLPINAHDNKGVLKDSGPFTNKKISPKLIQEILNWIEEEKIGKRETTYHLRDWLISRQRYWGCPIPMIYCKYCGWQPVPESDLPVKLPTDVDFLPHGESPIARSKTFQKGVKCPNCNKEAKREVDTMDTYVDSSWYFIRFVDPKNRKAFASAENIKKWLPVDNYVGGGHVVQHLLFARFFWKVIFDAGLIDKSLGDEPFLQLRAPGWILGPDSRKMSKRWGNVITPDDIIPKFGADVLRLYEMFMGPFEIVKPFNLNGVEGMHRFTKRIWNLYQDPKDSQNQKEEVILMHKTVQKVTKDISIFHYNTAISSIMEFVNFLKANGASYGSLEVLCQLIAPFAPHLAEELWVEVLGNKFSVHTSSWPKSDSKYLKVDQNTIIIQINGKARDQFVTNSGSSKEEIINKAQSQPKIITYLENKKILKTIYVPGKIINFVITNVTN